MASTIPYEPFDQLIVSLRNDGLLVESDLLHTMIYKVAWTTGSELMGELGQTINKIKKENSSRLSAESKEIIRAALNMVKRVWPGFN